MATWEFSTKFCETRKRSWSSKLSVVSAPIDNVLLASPLPIAPARSLSGKCAQTREKLFICSGPDSSSVVEMVEIVIKIPEELEELPEDWSAVALEAIRLRAFELKLKRSKEFRKLLLDALDKMLEHSTLTDEDCLRLGREVNRTVRLKIERETSRTG